MTRGRRRCSRFRRVRTKSKERKGRDREKGKAKGWRRRARIQMRTQRNKVRKIPATRDPKSLRSRKGRGKMTIKRKKGSLKRTLICMCHSKNRTTCRGNP